ncbi:MAG TPA: alpha-ketoacid dehydrogenase subunit beta [Anaerolinea thermolimosa]|uniref:Alpha-ketoacid dehydrogenase subunit beta n=1 Tax=Anaerolinea thermolimosa TaxID=229919 RepID=A0A0M8JP28_9CHLR|nr:alpha-ketoacid dehydrogenase subunit beta [Anaerolinea thermolimosa]GAP08800.1 pyruvate/2-oxoglutarate dehydrogenase complex, dehydrogenase (E1) component, eukaryotic type, beta subunit [Anaerolinea thermolimosa]GAP08850.1 pyruvate/2-oxoglutarate dehydrogenase complex, dehydrogenase (E1) component, eukaryotic type, beta subunit [Anaerolinea thermolimosa]HCE17474.1 alpha-ketoacid dehydrogenase subunit beta [Anaerolinea thermolimosa]
MPEITLIEAIRQALDEELARDDRVLVIGEDVGKRGGVFRATQGLYEKYGALRVFDSPLAEASIVGVGVGAALYGLRPVCEIQFADFIYPAFNQLISEVARMCYRTNGEWTVPMVIRAPYGGGVGGGLYHSQSVEAFFTHVPGLKVVIPSNPYDAKGLLKSAVRDPNPVLFFEPKKGYRLIRGEVPPGDYTVPIGPAQVSREGHDLSLFAYGMMHHYALEAAVQAAAEGISVEVVDLRTLLPVDRETILASVRKTGKALIVHEDTLTGGYGAEIAAIIASEAFTDLDAPVRRLCGPDVPAVPFSPSMQEWFMLNPERILREIRSLAAY